MPYKNEEARKSHYEKNKEARLAYQKAYYKKNKEAIKAYRENNKEAIVARNKAYYEKNKEARKNYWETYYREKYKDILLLKRYGITLAEKNR
jgi:hypothetical protein